MKLIPCPQCSDGHMIEVCEECGWPPALDGRCVCEARDAASDESALRRIFISMEEIETPTYLSDGEVVEAIRLGGPRDGDVFGYFKVERTGDDLTLQPTTSQT